MGIVEVEPEVFYISVSEYIYLNLNGWKPGLAVHPESELRFPRPIRGLNGSCVVAPDIILLASQPVLSNPNVSWNVDFIQRRSTYQ
jgi:hypothetical protein